VASAAAGGSGVKKTVAGYSAKVADLKNFAGCR
jgi:hypothetical protein